MVPFFLLFCKWLNHGDVNLDADFDQEEQPLLDTEFVGPDQPFDVLSGLGTSCIRTGYVIV